MGRSKLAAPLTRRTRSVTRASEPPAASCSHRVNPFSASTRSRAPMNTVKAAVKNTVSQSSFWKTSSVSKPARASATTAYATAAAARSLTSFAAGAPSETAILPLTTSAL